MWTPTASFRGQSHPVEGAGVVVGASDGANVADGASVGVDVGAGDGASVIDGADVEGAGVSVGASVLPMKPPHAQHWRLAVKTSLSREPQYDG